MCWDTLGLRVSGGGWDEADPGKRIPAANGGAARHPGRGGSRARGARPENKAPHLLLPSFHRRQPLSASLRWIVPAFSLLQLFTGSPWCRHAHKERAIVPVPPALPVPPRPLGHSGAIDPAGRACPGLGWGHPPLWGWDFKEGVPKGLGWSALPRFITPGLREGVSVTQGRVNTWVDTFVSRGLILVQFI